MSKALFFLKNSLSSKTAALKHPDRRSDLPWESVEPVNPYPHSLQLRSMRHTEVSPSASTPQMTKAQNSKTISLPEF